MTNAEMDSQSPFAGILLGQPTLRKRLRLGTMEQGIEELNRYTVGWMAYFALLIRRQVLREARRVAQAAVTAGAVEGMEAGAQQAAQPESGRNP